MLKLTGSIDRMIVAERLLPAEAIALRRATEVQALDLDAERVRIIARIHKLEPC